jgi:hypothetical protein
MQATVRIKRMTSKDVQTKKGMMKNLSMLVVTGKGEEMWIGGWPNAITKTWKEGDTVDLEVEQNGKYWNFKTQAAQNGHDAGVSYDIAKDIQDIKSELIKMKVSLQDILKAVSGGLEFGEEVPSPSDGDDEPF